MMLGKHRWRNIADRIGTLQAPKTTSGQTALRRVLGLGVLHSIVQVDIGVEVDDSRRSGRVVGPGASVGLRRERGRDGVGRGRETTGLVLGGKGSGGDGGESFLAMPEAGITRLWNIDRLRHSSEG